MEEHTDVKGCFAVWNTVEDKFLENKYGEQDFDSFSEIESHYLRYFASSMTNEKIIERVGILLSAPNVDGDGRQTK
jgi:hypothetical protein